MGENTNKDDLSASGKQGRPDSSTEKLSRREFAKGSVVAGAAAAVTIPAVLQAGQQATESVSPDAAPSPEGSTGAVEHQEGMTIPAEYYYEMAHYRKDEAHIAENWWLMADHVSRIPEPGDFFVFKFGLGESAIVVRNESGEINAFHNVCRHRGSRLCRHDEDPRPDDDRLSVRQLGESGNAQVFRCPYHAWLYDVDGNLIDAYGMHDGFDRSANGLIKCHMRIEESHIFLNFSRAEEPPPFDDPFEYGFREIGERYDMAALKVGTRKSYQMKANWKLGLENFMECYHCEASHDSLTKTHNWDYTLSDRRRERWAQRVAEWIGPELAAERGSGFPYDGELNPGFLTGSVDGQPVAPFLPGIDDWSHDTDIAITWFSTGYWQTYDDHIAVARFTPRGPELTDVEIFWLVHPDAVAGEDFNEEDLQALWDITIIEDAWLVENNHIGVKSLGYRPGAYSTHEQQPSYFATWYMREIVNA
ncbi:MAG: aromatic ring-hydroxylating dioxygenase subunit alpha [Gammaproteobacteria bacterium]|nr:aromatic ring-hydroxylating dioxygenase subunit alpha [Gammaproteobacteria bacterium]